MIAKNLRKFRLEHGLTEKQVSIILNVSEQDYHAIELGHAELSAQQLFKLCRYYNIEMESMCDSNVISDDKEKRNELPLLHSKHQEPVSPILSSKKKPKTKQRNKQLPCLNQPGLYCGIGEDNDTKEKRLLDLITDILVRVTLDEMPDASKLKEFPEGFHSERSMHCAICGTLVSHENCWYDQYGYKCMYCQTAIQNKIIPPEIIKNKELYYTKVELEGSFNLNDKVLRKWIKDGVLKERRIIDNGGKTHFQIFLISDQSDFLPPKKLLKIGGWVKEKNPRGVEDYGFYLWYHFVNPIEYLKDYKISHYFIFVANKK